MARRLLSHFLIMLSVFVLTATFFIWTIDHKVLNSDSLSSELRKAGVSQELSKLIPNSVTQDNKDASPKELKEMRQKISRAISADYIDTKISDISSSVLTFVHDGSPQPTISLSDFPQRLEESGTKVDGDFVKEFSKPISLNKDGKLDALPKAYDTFSMAKYIGILLFALLILAEWFVSENGTKIKRISRIFLYAGLWYLLYWTALIVLPLKFANSLKAKVQADFDASAMVDAVLKAIQGLFTVYFLSFAIGCLVVATLLYVVRYYKHGDMLLNSAKVAKNTKQK